MNSFYKKWNDIKIDNQIFSIERNFLINKRKIAETKPLYGNFLLDKLIICDQEKKNMIEFNFVDSIETKIEKNIFILSELIFSLTKIIAKPKYMTLSNYSYEYEREIRHLEENTKFLNFELIPYHFFLVRLKLCFPNKKIAIYDSGKLNMMMELLKKLKTQGHKIIIFTQMSKMLDIFEFALNTFNFTYVRLDGSTKPEMRQKIIERFNNDAKLFCFVSSTRSGGIGINLTGADVVIFYDTDWNPAMDKQAQDRCHRIGQTKNVKIYRLISEFTIEENILLKSIQKGKLDTFIMEEGKFNTDFMNNKVNVRELLGSAIKGSLDLENDTEDINYNDYKNALEKIEDPEDIIATKKAELEEKNFDIEEIDDFIKMNNQQVKESAEEDFLINFDNLPRIYQYGIQFTQFNSTTPEQIQQIESENENENESEDENEIDDDHQENEQENEIESENDNNKNEKENNSKIGEKIVEEEVEEVILDQNESKQEEIEKIYLEEDEEIDIDEEQEIDEKQSYLDTKRQIKKK